MYFYNRKHFYIILDKQNYKNRKVRSEGVKKGEERLKIESERKKERSQKGRKERNKREKGERRREKEKTIRRRKDASLGLEKYIVGLL